MAGSRAPAACARSRSRCLPGAGRLGWEGSELLATKEAAQECGQRAGGGGGTAAGVTEACC